MTIRLPLSAASLVAALVLSGGAAAVAATQYPSMGGTWNYGLAGGVHAYSDYFHSSRCHGSTVINDWGRNRSIDVAGGRWANAGHRATPLTGNQYYFRVC